MALRIGRYPPALMLGPDATLLEVLVGMAEKRVRHCVLVSGAGAPVGMVSARDVADFLGGRRYRSVVLGRFGGDVYRALSETRAAELSYQPAWVTESSPIEDVLTKFMELKVGVLLVLGSDGRVKGLISERHIANLFADYEMYVKVKEIMSTPLVTLDPHETVARALEVMSSHRIRRLPLVSRGTLSGIVTIKDVLGFIGSEASLSKLRRGEWEQVYSTPLQSIARSPVITVNANEDVGKALGVLKKHGIGCVVVVGDSGLPVGILTERDIITKLPEVKGVELFFDAARSVLYTSRVSF
uniref:CBS domain-containing protein n=1 Tax=Thermofilum pendens TaxID=2269 RepID=A0A7C4FC17_THEPE